MATGNWEKRLSEFKKNGRPEAVLMVAGQAELIRIAVAWKQTRVTRAQRPTKLRGSSEDEVWAWLWENARYDRNAFLARIPNSTVRTKRNLDALIANRILHPDGTVNPFVERYLRDRVVKLFAESLRERGKGAA